MFASIIEYWFYHIFSVRKTKIILAQLEDVEAGHWVISKPLGFFFLCSIFQDHYDSNKSNTTVKLIVFFFGNDHVINKNDSFISRVK